MQSMLQDIPEITVVIPEHNTDYNDRQDLVTYFTATTLASLACPA